MRVIDFFCGAGGSAIGAELAGGRIVAAVNHWEIAAMTYEHNHGIKPYRDNIADVDPSDLPAADVLAFSPECTNHSLARGARPRDEMSRNTAWEVVRFTQALAPSLVVIENVPAIRQWPAFAEWIGAIEDLGYTLNRDHNDRPGQVLNSADFGVPQARHRLFIVGARGGAEPHIQNPRLSHMPVGECIDWTLPMRRVDARPVAPSTQERIRLAHEQFGTSACLLVYYKSGPQVASLDKPCRTLPTRDRFALYQDGRMRMLQIPELKRIMGFPDAYHLVGTREQQIKQIGNAVAPGVMRGILEQAA